MHQVWALKTFAEESYGPKCKKNSKSTLFPWSTVLCVNDECIYNTDINVSIIGVSYSIANFTLSCVTSGGIATYINKDNCGSKQQLASFSQQVLDPFTIRYNNVLKWRSQNQSNYICSTRNSIAVTYAVLLTEFGAGKACFNLTS